MLTNGLRQGLKEQTLEARRRPGSRGLELDLPVINGLTAIGRASENPIAVRRGVILCSAWACQAQAARIIKGHSSRVFCLCRIWKTAPYGLA